DGHAQRDMSADDKAEFHDARKKEHERDKGKQKVGRSVDGRWPRIEKNVRKKVSGVFLFQGLQFIDVLTKN
ncbi:MAG: hypothetical protein MR335_01925, partial [Bacilli bacterium]|nr:hypothetical protein [Bacilli bacterium]